MCIWKRKPKPRPMDIPKPSEKLTDQTKETQKLVEDLRLQHDFRVSRFDYYDAAIEALLDCTPGAKDHPAIKGIKEREKLYVEAVKQEGERELAERLNRIRIQKTLMEARNEGLRLR